ncbi:MAG TPA: efflux RND transporter permease subunit [Gemmatimonadales bacterium]|nr:efflux RND transporter permease subunit [Gemmatimonadales bacterium]
MSIAGLVERHRSAVYLSLALLTLGGLLALFTLPAGIYPEVTYPRVVIVARQGTFEVQDMTVAVTRPIEEAMSGIIALQRIRSRTVRGATEISLDFAPNADMQYSLTQVQGRLAQLEGSLPSGLDITTERLTPSVFPIIQYELRGADPVQLRDIAQYQIRPRLARLPEVGGVEIQGGLVREVSVVLDPERLVSSHIGVDQVAKAIERSDVVTAAGRVDREYRQLSILVSGLASNAAAVAAIVVQQSGARAIRVGDLGTVRYGAEDRFQLITGDGQPAALINIARQPNGNALRIDDEVRAALDSVRPLLPAGAELKQVYNQATLVRESMKSVRDAMLVGGILAVLILFLFLGRWNTTFAAALSLPLAVIGTFAALSLTGQSLNLMSLGGLAVAIGLIIDDAVVVVENIERRLALHPDEPADDVIRRGTDEIFGPVAGSTLTTVVVFAPLGLLQGVVGSFFQSFSIALAASVLLSLAIAMTLIPALVSEMVRRARARGAPTSGHHAVIDLRRIETWYTALADRLIGHRRVVLGVVGLLLVGGVAMIKMVDTDFLPQMDEGGFILDYWTATGSSLAETDREVHVIEGILGKDPDIQAFSRRTGTELGFAATAPNRGDFTVLLKPLSQRHASVYAVMDRVRAQIDVQMPTVRVEFAQLMQDALDDLAGAPSPIEIKLFSPDRAASEEAARRVAAAIDPTPGMVDLFNGVVGPSPEVLVQLDPVRVARLGLTPADVLDQARGALFGTPAGTVREPDRLVPIRVRLPDSVRYRADIAATLPVVGPDRWAPLGALGTVRDTTGASEQLRENLRSLTEVTARVEGAGLGSVVAAIQRKIKGLDLPAGVSLEIGGQYASQQESFKQLLLVFALAAGAVLLVLVVQFRGVRGPATILALTPLGLTGAFAALIASGVPFNVSSFMGLILLIGLVVKNGILLFDAAQQFAAEGATPREALAHAGRIRLRPILMTTLCTLAGLLPLALGWGAGAELQKPLAIAVIGGLTVSTLVTLLLLPAALEVTGALSEGH